MPLFFFHTSNPTIFFSQSKWFPLFKVYGSMWNLVMQLAIKIRCWSKMSQKHILITKCTKHNSLKVGREMCHFTLALLPSDILQYLNEYFCHHNLHSLFGPSNNKQQPVISCQAFEWRKKSSCLWWNPFIHNSNGTVWTKWEKMHILGPQPKAEY